MYQITALFSETWEEAFEMRYAKSIFLHAGLSGVCPHLFNYFISCSPDGDTHLKANKTPSRATPILILVEPPKVVSGICVYLYHVLTLLLV